MCQSLGLASNRDVDMAFSFSEWRHRGESSNPHGSGFAFWPDGHLEVVKKARDLLGTPSTAIARVQTAKSCIFVCHVRFASSGVQDGSHTHPFSSNLNGKSFVFAHNGTIRSASDLEVNRTPSGRTDSERAFLWILWQVEKLSEEDFGQGLKDAADRIRDMGKFNFLPSDGATLWVYADNALQLHRKKSSLRRRTRHSEGRGVFNRAS
jgi:predicted glutamine amidotransferase